MAQLGLAAGVNVAGNRCCSAIVAHRKAPRPRCRATQRPQAFLSFFRRSASSEDPQRQSTRRPEQIAAVERLLQAIEGSERGVNAERRQAVLAAAAELAEFGVGSATTDGSTLSATWRLLWTTEKETLFIVDKLAPLFGTAAGDVFQVIDVDEGVLQNVITFPPSGAFVVSSAISIAGPQRTEFQFTAATLKLEGRDISLPPFGKGWFDTVYADEDIRVAQDSRGDTLVVARDGPPRRFN